MQQLHNSDAKGLGNAPTTTEVELAGGLTAKLNDKLSRVDLMKYGVEFTEIDGVPHIKARDAKTGDIKELPLTASTESLQIYKNPQGISIDIVDKTDRADGSKQITMLNINEDGYTISKFIRRSGLPISASSRAQQLSLENHLRGQGVEIDSTRGLVQHPANGNVFVFDKAGVAQKYTGSDVSLDLTETTQSVELKRGPGDSVDIVVHDVPNQDGSHEATTIRVLGNGSMNVFPPQTIPSPLQAKPEMQTQAEATAEATKTSSRVPDALLEKARGEKLDNFTEDSFEAKNVTEIWNRAFDYAKAYAKEEGYELQFGGSGVRARGLAEPTTINGQKAVNPIELQTLKLITPEGQKMTIGKILPEANHLTTLKSSADLYLEMVDLIDETLKRK